MVEVEIDSETGDEILLLVRRGRYFLVLRDRDTKRFIRFLRKVSVAVTKAVDYDSTRGRGHNLYVDVKARTDITPEQFRDRREIVYELDAIIDDVTGQYFGATIAYFMSTAMIGVEYSSSLSNIQYPKAHVIIAWGRDHPVKEDTTIVTLK